MRQAWIIACVLLFSAAAGSGQVSDQALLPPGDFMALLGRPAVSGSCPTPLSGVFLASGPVSYASCSANCQWGGTVSCPTGTNVCSAANSSCPSEQGHVTCDGVTIWCPMCCASNDWCCRCDVTQGCFECCRCDGKSVVYCSNLCSS